MCVIAIITLQMVLDGHRYLTNGGGLPSLSYEWWWTAITILRMVVDCHRYLTLPSLFYKWWWIAIAILRMVVVCHHYLTLPSLSYEWWWIAIAILRMVVDFHHYFTNGDVIARPCFCHPSSDIVRVMMPVLRFQWRPLGFSGDR